jgi:hypothetical protein
MGTLERTETLTHRIGTNGRVSVKTITGSAAGPRHRGRGSPPDGHVSNPRGGPGSRPSGPSRPAG